MEVEGEVPIPKRQRFKYPTFNQSVAKIGGDSAKFSRKLLCRSDDNDSLFFTEALTKWNDIHFGVQYITFVDSIPCDELHTIAQLLHHKKRIMELLLKNLHDPECKSTEPFCELLTALIRDLKDDCCEDIWNVLEALINVLDFGERDVQSVEVAFYSLSLIVRLMWKALIRDLNSCFVRFIPLLGSSRSYARRFAAECFSFVIRKSKNLMKISGQIVEQAYRVQDDRLREGCAELFFHVPRGIAGAFHSTANEKICSIISGILHLPNSDVREYGVTILEMFVQLLVQYVRKGVKADLSPLEVALLNMLEDLNSMELVTCMVRLLRLCFVQRKWVNMFSSNTKLLSVITKLLSSSFFEINSMFIEFLSECVLKVFPSSEWGHSIGCMCSTLVSKTGDLSAVFHFFNNAINLVYFDEHLMPVVGKFSAVVFAKEHGFIEQLLNLYSTVCLNKRPFKDIICGDVLQVLDLSIHMPVRQHIIQHIQLLCSIEKSVVFSMLVIWPWIRSNDDNVADVDNVMEYLNNLIRGTDYSLETSQTALIAVSSLFRVDQSRLGEIDICQVEEFVRGMNCCESALRLYHYYLVANEDLSTIITLKRVCDVLLPCYFHPNSSVRKTALEILSSFNIGVEGAEINTSIGVLSKQDSVFGILLAAECCDIVDSRARLLHFTKLTFGSHRRLLPEASGTTFDHVILRVALAQFFVQFTKLWSSMYGFLESFARGMDIDEFWSVITEVFDHLNAGCRDQCSLPSVASILPLCDRNDRADYYSARIQVLKFIGNVWDLAQRRTRILSPILLEIYGIEYLPFITERITSWQQRLPETTSILGTDSQKNEYSEKRDQYLTVTKTLCTFLDIYAKFTDAKSVYLESKIRDMYDHLLISGNDMVQKSVMACIFSYKDKALLPYQENFERLLNEKLFREQLVLFSINENEGNSIIHLDHRRAVMYILLRLLYGKLWAHTKRNVVESRRAAIFRYLGGCRPDELLDFLKILFGPILEVIGTVEMDFNKMEALCSDEQTLFKMDFIGIKRCLSSVSNLLVRIACVIVEEQRTLLFRLLLATAVAIKAAIVHPNMPAYLSTRLRDLRMSLTDRIGEFLHAYPQRSFFDSELKGLLSYMVLPYLTEARSIHADPLVIAPLSVIKILATVSAYPTHYHVLALHFEWHSHSGALMQLLVSPLLWPGLTRLMSKIIRKALLNLLTLADEAMTYSQCEYDDIPLQKDANYGTALVVEYVNPVVQFLSNSVKASEKKFDMTDLELLYRLSGYSLDEAFARDIICTVLSRLEKKLPKESTLNKLLNVVASLMGKVGDPSEFIKRLGPLFSKIEDRLSRQALVRICEVLTLHPSVPEDIRDYISIVSDLESWDRSRIDEPDHNRRHSAYSRLNNALNADAVFNLDVLRILLHAHYNTLNTTKDFSLRTSSASSLRVLIDYASRSSFEQCEKICFVNADIIHVLLCGIRSPSEIVREESIRCLARLIDCFPDHVHLKQLRQIRNPDEDLDFFANMIHIQLHRRQRAVHRLIEELSSGKVVIEFKVLNKYLIPIIHPYLGDTESKLSALSDECLRLLKYTMGIAPWSKYVSCLDLWLKRLDEAEGNHKAIIRSIVSIVDAFHYEVAGVDETTDSEEMDKRFVVRDKLIRDMLPKLTNCINGNSAALSVHRKARTAITKQYTRDDDIRRAPVALAIVKLLQKLPESISRQYLHGVVLKLCFLMMSRSIDVRDTARKVVVQVCESLGPRYLPVIIKEMKLIMTKGFQLHVMIYTVHTLIAAMQQFLKSGDLDACLDDVLDIIVQEQFGNVSEEKEVGEIKAEVIEAKKNRAPGTLLLLGRFVSSSAVVVLLKRFESIVDSLTSSKMISRARNLLSMFANGLKDNAGFAPTSQLILIHQMLEANIEKVKTVSVSKPEVVENVERPKSCLLLPSEPKRIGALEKPPPKSRSHIFLEFALQLLGALIRGKHFSRDDPDHISRMDPFLCLLIQCLQLKYEKVISHALRCLIGVLHLSLPSIQSSLDVLSKRLFLLLSEYSVLGNAANKESVLSINQLLCKSFTQLIVMSNTSFLTDEHTALLLSYVEIDIADTNRQATAFALIKALVRKKIQHPQVLDVIKKLKEMSVTSSFPHIRTQCREVLFEFIGNHPSSDDPQKYIEWFIAQLGYEFEDGRLSAVEMLHSLFSRLQPSVLNNCCLFNVSKLGASLFNEESPKCRRFILSAVYNLFVSVSESTRLDVFSACCDWLELQEEEQEGARSVAVNLLVQLSKVEGEAFCSNFRIVLPFLRAIFTSGTLWCNNSEQTISGLCYGIASMLQNLNSSASVVLSVEDFCVIFDSLEPLMKCEGSVAIRLSAACLIGQCLNNYERTFFTSERSMKLVQWCYWQLRDRTLAEDIALQASKILMAISRHLNEEHFNMLVEELANICRFEIVHQPNLSLKRTTCLKMAAALTVREEHSSKLDVIVQLFLPFLVHEMNSKSSQDKELHSISMEVGEVFKSKVGEQRYATMLAECQKAAVIKALQRKRKLKELSVTNPEEAALLKRKKTAKKALLKRRKIDALKPYRVSNRRRVMQKQMEQNED